VGVLTLSSVPIHRLELWQGRMGVRRQTEFFL